MLTDVAGADNAVSGGLRKVEEFIGGLQSATVKADQQEISRILKEAEGAGVLDQVVAGVKAFGVAPAQTTAQALGTMIPTIGAALIPGVGQSALAARIAAGGVGAAQGVGSVKGSIYDEVKAAHEASGMAAPDAQARAAQAQSYGSANARQMALGGVLGAVAGGALPGIGGGVEGAVRGIVRGSEKSSLNLAARVPVYGAAEAGPEFAQGAQEKYATNTALGNEGFAVEPTAGMFAAGTMEGLAGFGMGGAVGAMAGRAPKPQVPELGPLSRAANIAPDTTPEPPPQPVPLTPEQDATLKAHANARNAELTEKAKGTKDVKTPEGTIPGKQPEFLTPAEKEEQAFLQQNGGDTQALAKAYPGLTAEQEQRALANIQDFANEGQDRMRTFAPAPQPAPPRQPATVIRAEPEPRPQPPSFEPDLTTPAAIYESLNEIEQRNDQTRRMYAQQPGDRLNKQGKPFSNKAAAKIDQKKAGDGFAIVPADNGFVVRPVVGVSAEIPQMDADLPTLKKAWSDAAAAGRTEDAKVINDRILALKAPKNAPERQAPAQAEGTQAPAPAAVAGAAAPEADFSATGQPAVQAGGVAAAPRQGQVGDKFAAGEVALTASGRTTTPFPKVALDTNRKAAATIKAVDQWLMSNALAEAESRGDDFNARQFRANQTKPQQADKDSAEEYLFGDQPRVLPSITRPLISTAAAPPPQAQPAATAVARPNRRTKAVEAKAKEAESKRADYFSPGNIVKSFGGHDEVLSYTPTAGGGFTVKVHEVKKNDQGEWVRLGKPQDARQHATNPDARELAAGPVARLNPQPGAEVKYSEPRADGAPFQNAPGRGRAPVQDQANPAAPEPAPKTLKERREQAKADRAQHSAQGAIDAFNADDSAKAVQIMAKLKLDDLKEVGAAVGFRPQINETAKAFRERIGGVAEKLGKTAREKSARQRVLYDKLMDRAMEYDRAADHAARAKSNGVADDSTAYDAFYKPMGGGETQMVRIPALLDRLAADVESLRSDPEFAEVAPMVSKARPRVFEHKTADSAKQAPAEPVPRPLQAQVERPAAPDAVVASVGDPEAEGERKFYVTMVRGDRVARLAGPFDTKAEADAMLPRARDEANKADPRSAFDAFGVSGVTSKDHKPGVLNDRLGIGAEPTPEPPTPTSTAPAADDEAPQLTEAQARKQFEWRNLGQKDGTKTHGLFFYVKPEDKGTGRAMGRGNVEMFEGSSGWRVDGEGQSYKALADAKAAAIEAAIPVLRDQGWIAPTSTTAAKGVEKAEPGDRWAAMTVAQRAKVLDDYAGGAGDTDIGPRYALRAWDSFNVGEKSTLAAAMGLGKAEQAPAPQQENAKPAPASNATAANPLDAESNLWQRISAGKATPEEFKEGFQAWLDNKAAIVEVLSKLKKDELLKMGGRNFAFRYKSENKTTIVQELWSDGMDAYTLGRGYSYGMTSGNGRQQAIQRLVEATDADQLAQYAADQKAAEDEAVARVAKVADAIKDPKTLDDYKVWMRATMSGGKSFKEARMMLTPEQRAQFDDMAATDTRSKRKDTTEAQRTQVRVAGQTVDGDIIATKHTKKGTDLFVVKLAERVSREDYETLNTGAKRIGGYYSSFRGGGAIPGFQFTTREQAQAFVTLAQGDNTAAIEAAKERRDAFADDRSQTAVERLTEMADRLEERADESLGRERKANTQRRARFAANAEAAASSDKAMAQTMRNIAQAIGAGKAKFLDRVRQKTQVELLRGYVSSAKGDELRAKYPTYAEQERNKGERATGETADYAEFPTYTAYRSDLASLGRQLLDVEGTKKLGELIMKVADDTSDAFTAWTKEAGNFSRVATFTARDTAGGIAGFSTKDGAERAIARSGYRGKAIPWNVKRGEWTVIMSPSEAIARGIWKGDGDKRITLDADFGAELVEKMGKANRRGAKVAVPWQFERAHDRRKALERMGIETPAEFRAALREFIGLREVAAEPDKVKQMERAMIGRRNDGLDFFPTPESVADEMVAAADIQPGMRVLEPSAGMGHIAERIRAAGTEPEVGEFANDRRELLEAKGFTVVAQDFLAFDDADQAERGFTYGDLMEAPDGTRGILRGQGGMGSDRVRLVSDEADPRELGKFNFADLTGVERRGVGSGYDRILMNPPFSDGRDIQHVRHAYGLLKPGGRLVAIMGESAFTNQNKRATEFREWLESVGGTDEKLAEGTFNDPSMPVNTGANARMVVIEKGAADAGNVAMFSRAPSVRTALDKTLDAKAAFDAVDRKSVKVEDAQGYFDLSEAYSDAKDALAAEFLKQPDEGFALQGMTPDGRRIILNGSAQNPGQWQLTRFDRRGEPWGDSQYRTKRSALDEFLREIDLRSLEDMDGQFSRATGQSTTPAQLRTALEAEFSPETIGALERAGLLTIGDRPTAGMPSDAAGVSQGGRIGLFAGNTRPGSTAVAYHEALHATLKTSIGEQAYTALLDRLAAIDSKAMAGGATQKFFAQARGRIPADLTGTERLEELAAYTVESYQQDRERMPMMLRRWAADFMAALRAGLSKALQAAGVGLRIRARLLADPATLRKIARDGLQAMARQGMQGDAAMAFSRTDQTTTEAFKRWFGDSKVVDAQGRPLVVYHGTNADFSKFSDRKLGENTDLNASSEPYAQTSRVGFWFNTKPMAGKNSSAGYALDMPVYLSITNPKREMSLDWLAQGLESTKGRTYRKRLIEEGYDGIVLSDEEFGGTSYIAFRPEQIKSATGNSGQFNPASPDIRFSRTMGETLREAVPSAAQEWIADRATSQRGFNRPWHRTVGTQLHKAKINKDFGRVYYAAQDFMKDVSRIATLASDRAPDMLPQIETLSDMAKLAPSLASPAAYKQRKADIKGASDALFDGTLRYTRNDDGEAVAVDPDSNELGGLVWTDAELRDRGMSERAIKMYRQSREAIDQSLDSMLAADLFRQAGVLKPEMLADTPSAHQALLDGMRKAAASDNPAQVGQMLREAIRGQLESLGTALEGQPNQYTDGLKQRQQELRDLQVAIGEKIERIGSLKASGYAPLMRFGPYAVDVIDADGQRIFFGLYEGQAAANQAARNFRGQGLQVSQSVMPQSDFEALKGVSPETAMLFAEMLGVEKNEAMQTWLKNAVAEQSALKRHIRRKGIEGFDEDGSRVLAAFVTSNARAASRALHATRMADAVENVRQGDVKDEARALVEYINNPKEEAQAIRSLLFVQYIGGSVASALVNLTQTLVQTLPYLSQYGGAVKAGQRLSGAMKLALADKITDTELSDAVKRAEKDGVIKPQEVFQLQAEASRSLGSNLYVRSLLSAWGSMFQMAEVFNRRVAFIGAYNTAKEQGIADPFAFAENAVDETQSVFNKGNRPNWSRGAVGATLFTFKTFTIQYVEFLKRLSTAGEPGSPERKQGQRAAAVALMMLMILSGMKGIPFADDAEDLVDTVAQALGYNWVTDAQRDRWLDKMLGETMSDIVQHGLSGVPGVPFDVSQRLGMANLLPGTGLLKQSETNKQNQVLEVFGVAGSAVKDATQGQVLPLAIRNLMKGLDTYQTGMYRDGRGRNVVEADGLDAALKAIGLQPSRVASAQRDIGRQIEERNLYSAVKEEITDAMAQARFDKDADAAEQAAAALKKWNDTNPEAPIIIRPHTIQARVRQMMRSKAERTIANAPRPLRAATAEALQ